MADSFRSGETEKITAQPRMEGGWNVETLAGTKTLDERSSIFQRLNPGGAARDVALPAVGPSRGLGFFIYNAGTANSLITVKQGASTIVVLGNGQSAWVGNPDGTTWALMASHTPAILIADPGNAGAIPVTGSGVCAITTAGAETRTLAAPSFIGQRIALVIDVDGGTAVVTASAGINQAGNTIITMADVADFIELVCVQIAGVKRWRVVANDGCTLS